MKERNPNTTAAPPPGAATISPWERIARRLRAYEIRPQQLEMAQAVGDAFESGKHLFVEAGTGVGKSFAYLVPAIERVTQHGGRVVISTHTIALQEQLIEKDIPFLQKALPQSFRAVLVKGRSNYLGLRRLARASERKQTLFETMNELAELHRIEDWAYKTEDGSRSDLPFEPDLRVWDLARSDSDDCLGRKCEHYDKCFYQRARRKAVEAQLLIVNHAMLFSDLAVREQGASILPDYEYLILDEAHTVERVAAEHLGGSVSNAQVRHLLNLLHHERAARGVLDSRHLPEAIRVVENARRSLDRYFVELLDWSDEEGMTNGRVRKPVPLEQPLTTDLLTLADVLRNAKKNCEDESDRTELGGLADRCTTTAAAIANWHGQRTADWVYWLERGGPRGQRITLAARPLDVGPFLKEKLFDKIRSVVLTSATLAVGAKAAGADPFDYLRRRTGLSEAGGLALGSPFNYAEQLTVHVEPHLPDPASGEPFTAAACEAIKKYVAQSAGRAFVLFTSFDMLNDCARRLADFFEENHMPLLVHGSGLPRGKMLDKFRKTARSVLFGTDTFWQGVDVPGDALSNVIIVKLPFAAPNQPIVEARIEKIRECGGNPFMDFQLPEAVLKFKQGVGRLIRTKTDRGIVVILDPRVGSKPYGRWFLHALPECKVITS